ncbi:MAG: phosphatase PAP2 family protein [Erysipelotrichaceae bacterium]|nr:phosphatase PAP2 family protein [Erysipelotrichaceae bacterium]
MEKYKEMIRKIPRWGYIAGPVVLMLQYASYLLGELISHLTGTDSWAFVCKIPAIDDKIPLIPAFIVIYVFSFAFWIVGYIIITLTPKRNYVNYLCTLALSCFICFLTFIFAPTYMDRVAEGAIAQTYQPGFFNWLLGFIYHFDGWETGRNLLPSLHCLASTVCYLFIRRQPDVPRGFQIYTLIVAILICASTVLTKQHYIIDVPTGVGLAIICYLIVRKADPIRWLDKELPGEKKNAE